MKKLILSLALMAALVFPSGILADSYSQEKVEYKVSIDKKIRPINDDKYYDNISRDQKVFVSDDLMDFNIVVANTGKDILYDLVVTDYYPVVNQIILAPGEINKENRTVTWKISSLGVGETRSFNLRAKVATDSAAAAQTNVATVKNNHVSDRDTATFYITKKTTPKTGSNDLLVKSVIMTSVALAALGIRKLARGY